jgi:hypothetical protein
LNRIRQPRNWNYPSTNRGRHAAGAAVDRQYAYSRSLASSTRWAEETWASANHSKAVTCDRQSYVRRLIHVRAAVG